MVNVIRLAIDIGNSTAEFGIFENGVLVDYASVPTAELTYEERSGQVLAEVIGERSVEGIGLASVVPGATETVRQAILQQGLVDICAISPHLELPFQLRYETPATLGADRLAAAVGAWNLFHESPDPVYSDLVVISAGTALTIEHVSLNGTYDGGIIAPGPDTMKAALIRETAQLPDLELRIPARTIGTNTVDAIRSGIMNGYIEMVRGLIERMSDEGDGPAYVIATGGWSRILSRHVKSIDSQDSRLILKGINTLLELNLS